MLSTCFSMFNDMLALQSSDRLLLFTTMVNLMKSCNSMQPLYCDVLLLFHQLWQEILRLIGLAIWKPLLPLHKVNLPAFTSLNEEGSILTQQSNKSSGNFGPIEILVGPSKVSIDASEFENQ